MSLVRDALAHLYDPAYLQTHSLTRYLQTDPSTRKPVLGRALRQCLLEAIEALHPGAGGPGVGGPSGGPGGGGAEGSSDLARHSRVLQLRFIDRLDPQEVQSKLAISRSQFYREQQTAIEGVSSVLEARWGVGAGKTGESESQPENAPLAASSPELTITARPRHNLPLQLTSFVGRERELVEVRRLLGKSRLLTLTGAGGSGKTRLALEVAGQVLAGAPIPRGRLAGRAGLALRPADGYSDGGLLPRGP